MKQLKILGLAVVAAMALMVLAGTGTASATETSLCEVKETVNSQTVCPKEREYPAGTLFHAELKPETSFLLETPFGIVKCSQSILVGTTEQQTHIPLGATVNQLFFGECNAEVVVLKYGTLDIEIIDLPEWTHNGKLTFTGTEVTVEAVGFHCIYAPGETGTLLGGELASINLFGAWKRSGGRSGAFCGKSANASGVYQVRIPEQLWVSM